MIKITYQQLASMDFATAMQKLASQPLDIKTAYQVKKMAESCQKARGEVQTRFQKEILPQFAKKNEAGEVIEPAEIPEEAQAEFAKAREEFGKHTVEIDRFQFSIVQLGSAKLSASDLAALDSLISDPELASDDAVVSLKKV